jgi:peptidoglycan/xylan/chitin deacetylase (PgdA/CDA1 family)
MKLILKNLVYKLFSKKITWKLINQARNRLDIFCFHRVLPASEYDSLSNEEKAFSVTTEYFEQFLEFASNHYKFQSLDDGISISDSLFPACHITFDDGYKDNLKYALPILKKYSAPATIYIVDKMISRDITKPQNMSSTNIEDFLSWDEVIALDNEWLIEIGGHSSSHKILSSLSIEQLANEIKNSKKVIEKNLGHVINHFAYPYGGKATYNSETIKCIADCGYRTASTAVCKKFDFEKNLYELPRYFVTQNCSTEINLARFSGVSNIINHQLLP